MRRLLTLIMLLPCLHCWAAPYNVDSLFMVLDRTIDSAAVFISQRETRIQDLKEKLVLNQDQSHEVELLDNLFHQYVSYQSDSAMSYLLRSIEAAQHTAQHNPEYYKVRLVQQYSQSGLFFDAAELLSEIDPNKLSDAQKLYYYRSMSKVQFEIAGQTKDETRRAQAMAIGNAYRDSLLLSQDHDNYIYLQTLEKKYREDKDYQKALEINDIQMSQFPKPQRRYAIVASSRYQTYKEMKAPLDQQLYWLTESAIYDVRHAIMNQAALWELADILSREGDLNRSYKYICFSWDCATHFRSQVRTKQISPILSTINLQYQEKIREFSNRLAIGMWVLVLLVLLLLVLFYYLFKEHQNLKIAKHEIDEKNRNLSRVVKALDESNHKKEQYIGHFLQLCSAYIDKLESFRTNVLRKAQHGQLVEYLSTQRLQEQKEADQESLIEHFDHAFLELFPTFVEQFNAMLQPEARVVPARGEQLLTPQLRVFALIRLGIDDSAKISEFLNYSIRTIYNYRAKVNKQLIVPKVEFEQRLMAIV